MENNLLDNVLLPQVKETLIEKSNWRYNEIVNRHAHVWSDLTISEVRWICVNVDIPNRPKSEVRSMFEYSPYDIAFGDAFKKSSYEEAE